jgi:hypothetical protein
MTEWLILLLLVPAIVVPVVLLFGFAGCSILYNPDKLPKPVPVIVSAVGQDESTILVTWTYPDPSATFEFKRTNPDQTTTSRNVASFSLNDTGLMPGTEYTYQVCAVLSDGDSSRCSKPVSGTTFGPTFETTFTDDDTGWAGFCLVQRIEATRLSRSGTRVRITLRGAASSDASIDRIYISRPDPAGDPYDSAADLTPVVVAPFVLAQNTAMTLPAVDYTLDETQPLLIAVDFTAGPPSTLRYTPSGDAVAYSRPGAEAALRNRSPGYTPLNSIYLIEKIEVA